LGSSIHHYTSVDILEHACDSSSIKGSPKTPFPRSLDIKTNQTIHLQGLQAERNPGFISSILCSTKLLQFFWSWCLFG